MKKWIFCTLICTLALPFCHAGNSYPVPEDSDVLIQIGETKDGRNALNPDHISILVWNIFKGDRPNFKHDLEKLSKNKDILMLQEGYLDTRMKNIFSAIDDFRYDFATSFIYKEKNNTPTGVVTGSKIPPLSVTFSRSPGTEPVIHTPKMTILTEYSIEGSDKTLLVANIHSVNVVPVITQAEQLWAVEKILKNHQGPMVFAGDFNTWTWGKVETMRRVMRRLGMKEVTFVPDIRKILLGEYIDYIFVKDLEIINSKVWDVISGSDHQAMTVELKFLN